MFVVLFEFYVLPLEHKKMQIFLTVRQKRKSSLPRRLWKFVCKKSEKEEKRRESVNDLPVGQRESESTLFCLWGKKKKESESRLFACGKEKKVGAHD